MAPKRGSGTPWCSCGKKRLATLSPGLAGKWAEYKGIKWDYRLNWDDPLWFYCFPCHQKQEGWANDGRTQTGNRYMKPAPTTAAAPGCARVVPFHLTSSPPEYVADEDSSAAAAAPGTHRCRP